MDELRRLQANLPHKRLQLPVEIPRRTTVILPLQINKNRRCSHVPTQPLPTTLRGHHQVHTQTNPASKARLITGNSKVYLTNATFEITSSGTFLPNGTNIYTASKPSNAGCSYPVPEFGPSENCVAERDLHLVVTTALITREEYYAMGLGYPSNATVAPRSNSSAPKTSATGLSKALYADAKNDMR